MADLNSSGWEQQDQRSSGARRRDSMKEDRRRPRRWSNKLIERSVNGGATCFCPTLPSVNVVKGGSDEPIRRLCLVYRGEWTEPQRMK